MNTDFIQKKCRKKLPDTQNGNVQARKKPLYYYSLEAAAQQTKLCRDPKKLALLPYSLRILLEAAIRGFDGNLITLADIRNIFEWQAKSTNGGRPEVAFIPGRVVLQDFTGVPAIVDLASMRTAMKANNQDPQRINPKIPVDLVIDHSVQVDYFATKTALAKNIAMEFARNKERYQFLKWGEQAFKNFRVIPPGYGIIHQINLEYLATVTLESSQENQANDRHEIYPDTLVGTDSHTTMINGLGVLGWGVGGIEAEAAMLGQPINMILPDVIGFELKNHLSAGATATDLVLRVTEILRQHGVVGKFIEFYGQGLDTLPLADRATIANMSPEFGATCTYFPVDEITLEYLRKTGRSEALIDKVKTYFQTQGLFRSQNSPVPEFTETLELDLSNITPSVAGPKRPQDRIELGKVKEKWGKILRMPVVDNGYGLKESALKHESLQNGRQQRKLEHGSIVIAAVTSCTNTSNPRVMMAAGLLAKNACARGMQVPSHVKTSLAPGSQVVTDYLRNAGLEESLEALGFHTVGYGCTTCIGNSGPLAEHIVNTISEEELIAVSVLSGNRNFEGRISPHVKANFLASPPLVIAYALAGNININLLTEPLGQDKDGADVFLRDLWPNPQTIDKLIDQFITTDLYKKKYANIYTSNSLWEEIKINTGDLYQWDSSSTYIREVPFFKKDQLTQANQLSVEKRARCLVKVGDSVTTDHISPAGAIASDLPAGKYLLDQGIGEADFNSYGSRRGNDEVMTRGTFGNIRLRNQLGNVSREGPYTLLLPDEIEMPIYEASQKYRERQIPLIVLAGKEYGTGSSRDWAAKGTLTLGCIAVIAVSFERIHRANLVGMGILPLQFLPGESANQLKLTGREEFVLPPLPTIAEMKPQQKITITVIPEKKEDQFDFQVICRLDTPMDIIYYQNGGILHTLLKEYMQQSDRNGCSQ